VLSVWDLPDRPWWGLFVGSGGTLRRVASDSPAADAGIRKGEQIVAFGAAPWDRPWERLQEYDHSVSAQIRATDGTERRVTLAHRGHPHSVIAQKLVFGFIAISFAILGLVVFLSRADLIATLFFAVCLLFSRVIQPAADPLTSGAYLFDKTTLDLATLFLPVAFLHFFLYFPRRFRVAPRMAWVVPALYGAALVASLFAIRFDFDLVVRGAVGPSALMFEKATGLLLMAMTLGGVVLFVQGIRRSTASVRHKLRWVLPGTALGVLPPLTLAAIFGVAPGLEFPGDRYVVVTLVLVPLAFANAIFRYGLMDLELIVKRSVLYATLTALLVALYYVVAELLGSWLSVRVGIGQTLLSFGVVFTAALLFVPVRDRLQRILDRTLYPNRHSYRETLRRFAGALSDFVDRDELVGVLVEQVGSTLDLDRVVLFSRSSPEDTSLHLTGTRGIGESEVPLPYFQPSSALVAWWRSEDAPLRYDRGAAARIIERLPEPERALWDAVDPEILVVLSRQREIEGILALGPKRSGEPYRSEDLELLATLGHQAGTALANARLQDEAYERRRMEEELSVARRIQAALLPAVIPQPDGVEIAVFTKPSRHVGGDFYDVLDFGVDGLGLAVADVSGKGVPAALILSGLQATLRSEATPVPEPLVQKVNARLCADTQPGSFASLLYGHLDVRSRSFRYVNAGHPAGIVVRRDGHLDRLAEGGILLGFEPNATYVAGHATFEAGDLLFLYSDGVTDVLNDDDEDFGTERLERLLRRLAHLPVQAVVENIVVAVETFVGGSLPDDITIVVTKFFPATKPAV
jgi:sigma-B regulation protein RsbU (phosphoserine phosphatase)